MTPLDNVRRRVTDVMQASTGEKECGRCNGTGRVKTASLTQKEIAEATGIGAPMISKFLLRKTTLNFDDGLRLMSWLDKAEYRLRTKLQKTGEE